MPSWKKVILSGSDAALNSLDVTTNVTATSFTGSLLGTASYADQALTASFAISASYAPGTSQTLQQVTDNGNTTTNFIEVGSISTFTTGGFIAGVFKTTDGPNTVILESTGTGGTNPGSTILQFRDSKGTQTNGSITYGGNAGDWLRLNTSAGTVFGITGSGINSTYVFTGNNSGTGSFSWDLNTTFIEKIGGGTTQFLGNATTATTASFAISASYAPGTSQTLQQVTDNGNTTTNGAVFGELTVTSTGSQGNISIGTPTFSNILRLSSVSSSFPVSNIVGLGMISMVAGSDPVTNIVPTINLKLNDRYTAGQQDILTVKAGTAPYSASNGTVYISRDGTSPVTDKILAVSGSAIFYGGDVEIEDWGSISASLASISSASSNLTLQQVTDNGSTTTNNITVGGITASGLIYPSTDGTLNQAIVTDGSGNLTFADVVASTANNTVTTGKNMSGAPIAKGTPLYFTGSGTSGNLVGVLPADAGNPALMPAGGIAGEAIAAGAEGVVFLNGYIGGVDTSAFTSGDQVYVAVGGGYTNVVPTGSALVQKLGNVEKVDNTNGSGVINGPGAVRSVPNINPGYTWVGNGDWVATPISTASLFVTSASYALTSTSASHALNSNNAISSSYAVSADTASFLPATTNLNIASISASNAVFQSASIGYLQSVTGSIKVIGDAFIILNNDTPTERYAGIIVQDSGSTVTTASFQYDGQTNDWFYEYTDDGGATVDFGVALFGPEYNTKGAPNYLTNNRIPKSNGNHHLNDSNISDNGTVVAINSNTQITGSLVVTGDITGSDVRIDDWGSISASLASIEAGVATQTLQDVTDNGNTTTNSIAVTGFTSSIAGGNGITGIFRSTNGYNRLFLISTGSTGTNFGEVNIILRDSSDPGGVNNDGIISYGGANTATLSIKTATNNEFKLQGTTTDHVHSFSDGGTGSLVWNSVVPFIQRTGSGQTKFLGLATSASYSTQALSASFATTASYVATASYVPTLQQVTNNGNITSNDIIVTGSSADSLRINSEGFIVSGSLSGPTHGKTHQVIYSALSVNTNSTTTIAQLPAPAVAGFTFDYIAYVSGTVLQAGRAGVVKGILRNTETGVVTKAFQINETTTLDLEDQGFGTDGLQFSIVQDTNGTSNQLVAITNNVWPYEINYTLTIYYNPNFS